jgi:serine/threonine protein kinase
MGAVLLARDLTLGRRVAIKFVMPESSEAAKRFLAEARATAACRHENIVVIHEVGQFGDLPFMVLEYLEGQSLRTFLRRRALAPARTVELIVPVVKALAYAHAAGIVHRDLKLSNILLTPTGTVKVLDFGVAKMMSQGVEPSPATVAKVRQAIERAAENRTDPLGGDTLALSPVERDRVVAAAFAEPDSERPGAAPASTPQGGGRATGSEGVTLAAALSGTGPEPPPNAHDALTRVGAIVGTPPYMAPEQFGLGTVDARTDIWAVGIIMFQMLSGRHPLRDTSLSGVMCELAELERPLPRNLDKLAAHVPRELRAIVDHCLQKRQDRRWQNAASLLQALEPLLPRRIGRSLQEGENPYPGLSAFQETDADRFFGRRRETLAFTTRLRDQPLMCVVGASGVGKSSFVRAGLVPALRSSGESWDVVTIRPGRHPISTLATQLASFLEEEHEQAVLERRLRDEPGCLGRLLRDNAEHKQAKVLLFVDQFEETYTLVHDPDERRALTTALMGTVDDPVAPIRLVVSIRADMLDRLTEDRHFAQDLLRGLFLLTAPDHEGLREALVEPLEMVDYRIDSPTVIDEMLAVLETTAGALPLLQFTMARLWEARDTETRTLTRASYDALGGIAGALASHADVVVARLPARQQSLVREMLPRLITPERTRAIVDISELEQLSDDPDLARKTVQYLADARLLVVQTREDEQGTTVEIVHESLIASWPTLGRWLDESAEDNAFIARVRTAAKQWEDSGRRPGLLWRGDTVDEARHWAKRTTRQLGSGESAFLRAVFKLADQAARRRRAATMAGVAFLSLLCVVSVIVLLVLRQAERAADRQATLARQEAERARDAERRSAQQLELLSKKERQRQRALKAAETANTEIRAASVELAAKRSEIKQSNEQLLVALDRAQKLGQRARAGSNRAKAAEQEVRKTNVRLRDLLAVERARVAQLEREMRKITTVLK